MGRWIRFVIAIVLGIGLGLAYGWVLSPVQYVDTAPDSLRADFKTDYVLMVAEAFNADENLALAVRRLALLGGETPEVIVVSAIRVGEGLGYYPDDLGLMEDLRKSLRTWNPSLEVPTP
jgi:hypothetical protein